MISKKRYWGLALPIYVCPSCGTFEVIGSEEELQERAVEGWARVRGPYAAPPLGRCGQDQVLPACGELVSRIPDVGNPWLDAGIVTVLDAALPQRSRVLAPVVSRRLHHREASRASSATGSTRCW